jgi:hypothetical protein
MAAAAPWPHPTVRASTLALFIGRQDHGMALGWIGSTTAFGDVVRKPYT